MTIDLIAYPIVCLRDFADLIVPSLRNQCLSERSPRRKRKASGQEEAGFAGALFMRQVEQVIRYPSLLDEGAGNAG